MLSNSFVTVIVVRNETKGNLSKKEKKNRLTDKTDNYYLLSQITEKTKWNQLNQIKENKNSFRTSFKSMWFEIKAWIYFGLLYLYQKKSCSNYITKSKWTECNEL